MENREKMASATTKEQKYGGFPANISQTTRILMFLGANNDCKNNNNSRIKAHGNDICSRGYQC